MFPAESQDRLNLLVVSRRKKGIVSVILWQIYDFGCLSEESNRTNLVRETCSDCGLSKIKLSAFVFHAKPCTRRSRTNNLVASGLRILLPQPHMRTDGFILNCTSYNWLVNSLIANFKHAGPDVYTGRLYKPRSEYRFLLLFFMYIYIYITGTTIISCARTFYSFQCVYFFIRLFVYFFLFCSSRHVV